jgi:hypothetical protein
MEQRAIIRFLTLIWLKLHVFHTELESTTGKDTCPLTIMLKWCMHFLEESTDRVEMRRLENS